MMMERKKALFQPNPELIELSQRIPHFSPEESELLVRFIRTGEIYKPEKDQIIEVKHTNMPVIEVAGQPKSMKTSMIAYTVRQLKSLGIKADAIPEPEIDIDKGKYPVKYTLIFGAKVIENLLSREKEDDEIIFLDRGVFDRIGFLHAQMNLDEISYEDFQVCKSYLMKLFSHHVDSLIICNSNHLTSLRREGPRDEPGNIMNETQLSYLNESYKDLPETISFPFSFYALMSHGNLNLPVVSINTNYVDQPNHSFGWKHPTTLISERILSKAEVKDWEEYSDVFMKAVGTFSRLYTSGGKLD